VKTFSSFLNKKPIISHIAIAAFWFAVWELFNFLIPSRIIIVSPRAAFLRLFELARTYTFWLAIGTTLGRVLIGFLLAMCTGIILAALSSRFIFIRRLFQPAVNVMNAIPIASFVILALMAVSARNLSVIISFVTVLPIVYHNTLEGITATNVQLLQMANVFRVGVWKKIWFIYRKTVSPFIFSAASAGIGFAWKSGIAAELIGVVRNTIGGNLHMARIFLETADVFAWTIAIVLLSYVMEKVFKQLVTMSQAS